MFLLSDDNKWSALLILYDGGYEVKLVSADI